MPQDSVPNRPSTRFSWDRIADSLDRRELFDGIVGRRVAAYLIDVAILLGFGLFLFGLVVLTLGLLGGMVAFLAPVIPLAYHTLLIGGRDSATLGMRMMGVEVRTLTGDRPDLLQAFLLTALFYATMALTGLLLVVALFNERGRCLHDWLSGTVTVRAR